MLKTTEQWQLVKKMTTVKNYAKQLKRRGCQGKCDTQVENDALEGQVALAFVKKGRRMGR